MCDRRKRYAGQLAPGPGTLLYVRRRRIYPSTLGRAIRTVHRGTMQAPSLTRETLSARSGRGGAQCRFGVIGCWRYSILHAFKVFFNCTGGKCTCGPTFAFCRVARRVGGQPTSTRLSVQAHLVRRLACRAPAAPILLAALAAALAAAAAAAAAVGRSGCGSRGGCVPRAPA
eukprot:scaffold28366_cov59-Phaeocystis_antarctica.AAC.3